MIYCYVLTICCPGPFLRIFGIRTPEQQRAWREKMGLIGIITLIMSAVGFLTFGFTQTVCGTPPDRYTLGTIDVGSMTFNGYDYSFDGFIHPQVGPFGADTIYNRTNPIYSEPWSSGGQDGSLLFQKIGAACSSLITNRAGGGQPERYFDCTLVRQDGKGGYANNTAPMCHTGSIVNQFQRRRRACQPCPPQAWPGLAQLEQRHRHHAQPRRLPRCRPRSEPSQQPHQHARLPGAL